MWLFFALGCNADSCYTLCATTAPVLEACLPEWGATWEDLDATSRIAWGDRCRADWEATRVDLELRQVTEATETCTDAADQLPSLTCDDLRAMYLEP